MSWSGPPLNRVSLLGLAVAAAMVAFAWVLATHFLGLSAAIALAASLAWFLLQSVLIACFCEGYAKATRADRQFSIPMMLYGTAYLAVDFAAIRVFMNAGETSNGAVLASRLFAGLVFIVLSTPCLLFGAEAMMALAVNVKRLFQPR